MFFNLFKKSTEPMEPEVFQAYYNRLPDKIKVDWFRDGKYIIGNIEAGEYKFITQGKNGDDFIKMVNDALFTVYDIPAEHCDTMMKYHGFTPPKKLFEELGCKDIQKSKLVLAKV